MTYDLTGIAVSILTGIFGVLGIVLPLLINARIKDSQAATVLGAAVKNALGAMQVATEGVVTNLHPTVALPVIPGAPPQLASGVQYVLDHAGPEAARFGITPAAIADKINAQIGLSNIAANIAVAVAESPPKPIGAAPVAAAIVPPPPPVASPLLAPFVVPIAANAPSPVPTGALTP